MAAGGGLVWWIGVVCGVTRDVGRRAGRFVFVFC